MRRVTLAGTNSTTSRFIFGTASLFNVGASARQHLIDAAVDHGFTHFDTAPLYGFGHAERALAPMLRRRPDVTVTTKVGLYAPGGEKQLSALVLLRKAGGRLVLPALSRAIADWHVARGRASLDGSLARLGRDRIDLYMLHEPDADLLDTDEWQRWLESEKQSGRIGAFGIAADETRALAMLRRGGPLCDVIQMIDSLDRCEADQLAAFGRPMQITYGYVSAASRAGPFDGTAVIRAALRRNPHGAIIVSTRRAERMAFYRNLCAEEAV